MTTEDAGFDYDVSDRTVLVRCLGCGWRHLALRGKPDPRDAARRQAHSHERRAHPGQTIASDNLTSAARNATRRAAAGNDAGVTDTRSRVPAWASSPRSD